MPFRRSTCLKDRRFRTFRAKFPSFVRGKIFFCNFSGNSGSLPCNVCFFASCAWMMKRRRRPGDAKLFHVSCRIQNMPRGKRGRKKLMAVPLTKNGRLHTQKESSLFVFRSSSCPHPSSPCPSPVSGGGVSFLQGEDAVLAPERRCSCWKNRMPFPLRGTAFFY